MRGGTTLDTAKLEALPYQRWTQEDCAIYLKDMTATNVYNKSEPLRIFVTPCTPSVVFARNRLDFMKHQVTEAEFWDGLDRQTHRCLGGSFDQQKMQFLDAHGNYIRDLGQLDSILCIIVLESATSLRDLNANPELRAMLGLNLADVDKLFPRLNDLGQKLWLTGSDTSASYPISISGMNGTSLIQDQTLYVTFPVNDALRAVMRNGEEVQLHIDLSDHPSVIPVRFQLRNY